MYKYMYMYIYTQSHTYDNRFKLLQVSQRGANSINPSHLQISSTLGKRPPLIIQTRVLVQDFVRVEFSKTNAFKAVSYILFLNYHQDHQ